MQSVRLSARDTPPGVEDTLELHTDARRRPPIADQPRPQAKNELRAFARAPKAKKEQKLRPEGDRVPTSGTATALRNHLRLAHWPKRAVTKIEPIDQSLARDSAHLRNTKRVRAIPLPTSRRSVGVTGTAASGNLDRIEGNRVDSGDRTDANCVRGEEMTSIDPPSLVW